MSSPEPDTAAEAEPPLPPGLENVGVHPSDEEARERGLVVLAMGLPYWIGATEDGHTLYVEPGDAETVRVQLALFEHERVGWPPPRPVVPPLRFRALAPLLWAGAVIAVFRAQLARPGALEDIGALDGAGVFARGEWWRPATALFLHGDVGHLLGNLAAGFFLFGLVLGTFGLWRGGAALVMASLAGNLAAAALHPWHGYVSIGASTAVFAALGLLTGAGWRTPTDGAGHHGWRTWLRPALGGLCLLSLYGAGGPGTDVVAHATGFIAGVVTGLLARR